MRYPPDLLDEIRGRLSVSRVVERRVKLKRAGREYIGLSPFKTERTPSFTVNDQKGFYHCFASGEHGDIFTFLMKTEGLNFSEAVERLAAEAGVVLPAPKAIDQGLADKETRLRDALEQAACFFAAALNGREGEVARSYLDTRGIQPAEVRTFRLGFAPESRLALKTHLAAKGFSVEEMQEAGLLIHGDEIAVPYDRFRGRLIFPIVDAKRRIIAFGGRSLSPDRQPKYLNSPDTLLFHKGHVLFNFAAAREAARASKGIIVAEGYMDVIALHRAGYANAVAPLGTALTIEQLRLLWTVAPMPTLCFDGDPAGQKAAYRALEGALPYLEPGRSLQFVFLPDAQDPDDMVRRGERELLSRLLDKPVSLVDVMWLQEQGRHPLETPEQRASLELRLMDMAGRIQHAGLRFQYISALRERLRAIGKSFRSGQARRSRAPSEGERRLTKSGLERRSAIFSQRSNAGERTRSLLASRLVQSSSSSGSYREILIIAAILRHPWLLDCFLDDIAGLNLQDHDCSRIRDRILAVHQLEDALDKEKLLEHLSRSGYAAELQRVERVSARMPDPNFAPDANKDKVLEGWHHILMLHCKVGDAHAVREAESEYFNSQTSENFTKLRAVVQQVEIASS